MDMNIEKEYKVLLNKEQFEELKKHFEPLTFIEQTNTYYDNQTHTLQNMHGAMRIRSKEDKYTFTLKLPAEDGLYEFECPVEGDHWRIFSNMSIYLLLEERGIYGSYFPIASLKTKRAIVNLPNAELCFDISEYNDIIDYEIEYEYKRDHDGLKVFQEILDHIHIQYTENAPSKIQRTLMSIK